MAEDGNFQDISVHEKDVAALGPTEEAQDVAQLNRVVIPPGSFTSPDDPTTAAGSVNMSLNDHPAAISPDYGAGTEPGIHDMKTAVDDAESGEPGKRERGAKAAVSEADRAEWSKADWQAQAEEYGLAKSGNMDTIKQRVEDHEAAEQDRENFAAEAHGMSRDDLDKAASNYGIDPDTYSRKEDLADAVVAAEFNEDVPPGDKAGQ